MIAGQLGCCREVAKSEKAQDHAHVGTRVWSESESASQRCSLRNATHFFLSSVFHSPLFSYLYISENDASYRERIRI